MVALTVVNKSLSVREHPLASATQQLGVLDGLALGQTFDQAVASSEIGQLDSTGVDILQLNVGRVCNQTCRHCHVDAGPDRTESMSDEVVDACLALLEKTDIGTVDITGGAPELHPRFREIVERAHALGRHVMDRCNLTILEVKKYEDLPEFFAANKVEVVCSLPFPSASSTDSQRGDGVWDKSIRALQRLNEVGYGQPDSGLRLVLVSNPVGAFLPAPQASMEQQFRDRLRGGWGIEFNTLFSITNMPISRYLEWLQESGNLETYMQKLVSSFNPSAAAGVMCRNTLSVGWDGGLFDCDFNQMLELPLVDGEPQTIQAWLAEVEKNGRSDLVDRRRIRTRAHCFGCTAGQGSSCGGATA